MNELSLVDPELKPLLELFPAYTLTDESLAGVRAGMVARAADLPIPAGAPQPVERFVPGAPGAPAVRVLVFDPGYSGQLRPAVLHIPGGGYVLSTADVMAAGNASLAQELGCVVVSVDYRVAPETPHPGPLDDCYAALQWLYAEANALHVDPQRIGVGGVSAGGGLAAALALLVRDRGEMSLAFQHLTYPMLDDRTCTAADQHRFTGNLAWNRASNAYGWRALLAQEPGSADIDCYAAPTRADNLAGLPPTFLGIGALDLFLDENLEYARRLTRAGVAVELHVYPGAFHSFERAVDAQVTREAIRISRRAYARFFSAGQNQ